MEKCLSQKVSHSWPQTGTSLIHLGGGGGAEGERKEDRNGGMGNETVVQTPRRGFRKAGKPRRLGIRVRFRLPEGESINLVLFCS